MTTELERIVMRSPVDETKEPAFLVVTAYTVDRLLRVMREYVDATGVSCGLGPVVSDLSLMAMGKRFAIETEQEIPYPEGCNLCSFATGCDGSCN